MSDDTDLVSTSVRLREEQLAWFRKHNISYSEVVRELVDEYIEDRDAEWNNDTTDR